MAEKKTEEKKAENPETVQEQEEKQSYLKDLMAISGHGGLFKFISQARNGIIVESLETGKRMNAFTTMKVSALKDIAVYTEDKEIPLEEVLVSLHKYENGGEAISPKSDTDDMKDYFSAVLPEYDRDRVYVSDIKKILTWYNLLLKYDLLKFDATKPAQEKPAQGEKKAEVKPEKSTPSKESDQEET
ncbi:MAG: DUF5606 domain-containing protein [Bacteroidales bacterium]|nr:DUF5606 domain-containing protein [Bacteroidales bacterium]